MSKNAHKLASAHMESGCDRSATGQYRSIIYSTQSPQLIKQLVVEHYGFDDSTRCIVWYRGVSDTYKVSVPGGLFALKLYRSGWRTQSEILGELAALKHLDLKGIGVVKPVPRKDGGLITEVHAPEGPRSAVLFHWASGCAPRYTDTTHSLKYGQLLARLHIAGDDFSSCDFRPKLDLNYILECPLKRIRPELRSRPLVAEALDDLIQRLRACMSKVNTASWDWGFCHGDIWSDNAHIDGDHCVLLDFDFCGPGWRLFDLASYRWHARTVGKEEETWEPFLEGYLQVRPLSTESLRSIGLFMIFRHLWTTAHWIELSTDFGDTMLPDEYFDELVPFCEKIEADVAKNIDQY